MLTAGLFSSTTDEWETPRAFFAALDAEFHFETDVCATAGNAKCDHFYTAEQDGLAQEWRGTCWCNPPYGRHISRWIRKAHESAQRGATVACLVPARTDTDWWHRYCLRAEVRFVRGRLKFSGARHNAPFPCAVVVFRPARRTDPLALPMVAIGRDAP